MLQERLRSSHWLFPQWGPSACASYCIAAFQRLPAVLRLVLDTAEPPRAPLPARLVPQQLLSQPRNVETAGLKSSPLSAGAPAWLVTEANKRSHKKYHRGFFYDSTDARFYFICLPGVAPCFALIGLAVLGEIFLFFPSDMIRFVEPRAEQSGDAVLNHRDFPALRFRLPFARTGGALEPSLCRSVGITSPATVRRQNAVTSPTWGERGSG